MHREEMLLTEHMLSVISSKTVSFIYDVIGERDEHHVFM